MTSEKHCEPPARGFYDSGQGAGNSKRLWLPVSNYIVLTLHNYLT